MEHATTTLHYVNALAGAGKTYALVRHAHQLARRGQKVLFVQPTRDLIDKTVQEELGILPPVTHRVIHGGSGAAVVPEIVGHFKDASDGGQIVFITHAAFLLVPFLERRQEWIVIIDEVLQVDECTEFNIPENKDLLLPHITTDAFDARYGLVRPSDKAGRAALKRIAENKTGDDVWDLFSTFARRTLSNDWSVFALESQLANLRSDEGEQRRLISYALLEPSVVSGFKQVIMAGACFEDTILYRLWLAQGVSFKPFRLKLRYDRHDNGGLLRILYSSDEPWSKSLRNRSCSSEGGSSTVLQHVVCAIREEVSDRPMIWMGNKDLDDGIFNLANARRLPNSPHGLNSFQEFHITAVLSALNPTPAHFGFLDAWDIDGDAVRTAGYRQAVYQAALRSSLRNPLDHNPKTVIVMDRDTAQWLGGLFPGATIAPLAGEALAVDRAKVGRPRKHTSDAARQEAHRRRGRIELLIEQGVINGDDLAEGDYADLVQPVTERMSELCALPDGMAIIDGDREGSAGTVFSSIYDKEPLAHVDYGDDDSFIAGLRDLHSRRVARKEDAGLISPAHFDAAMDGETARGLANIRFVRGVWLDNDGGDLRPEEFARLFPKVRMAVWNTYSSTPENPRWRAFIPTTQAMSKKVHRLILDQIIKVLNKEGYWSPAQLESDHRIKRRRTHGFDLPKIAPSSLFYLPAQAGYPDGSFFLDYAGQARRAIDPSAWIKRANLHLLATRPAPSSDSAAQTEPTQSVIGGTATLAAMRDGLRAQQTSRTSAAERAEERWRSVACTAGVGHQEFYRLASALHRSGLSGFELQRALHEHASAARNPGQRRREIGGLIRSVERGRR